MTIKEFLLTKECEGYPSAWHAYVYNSAMNEDIRYLTIDHSEIFTRFNWDENEQGFIYWSSLYEEYEELNNKQKQRNLVELFHTYDVDGYIAVCDEHGHVVDFKDRKLQQTTYSSLRKKNIIKDMPSRWLDLDTWELVEKDDE